MKNLTMTCETLKKGFKYTIKDGDTVIDTRKSDRVYVAASVPYVEETNRPMRPLYHGRLDLIGKGEVSRYVKAGYKIAVAKLKNNQ